jgi:hypothetical protein
VTSGFCVFSDLNCNVIDLLRESDAATFSPVNEFEERRILPTGKRHV